MDTEIGELGFSANELQTGYALLQETDATLAPFLLPRGSAQTDVCAKLFTNFRELANCLARFRDENSAKQIASINEIRS